MGQLLREVLRTLCDVNQWCYAVFWKIGCQNPKLLIWEECYYEPRPCSVPSRSSRIENPELPFGVLEEFWASDIDGSQLGIHARDSVQSLIYRMMKNNQVNVVGEGMVGRAAFTGKHEWILANSYLGDAHPPEVLNEVHRQFSSGMQTVAVIPVCHGVVQLGSKLAIMENVGFVNNVKSLILQLGCVPGTLLPDNLTAKEYVERIGMPISPRMPVSMHLSGNYKALPSTTSSTNGHNQESLSSHAVMNLGRPPFSDFGNATCNLQTTASTSYTTSLTKPVANSCERELKVSPLMKLNDPFRGKLGDGVVDAEVIPSNPDSCSIHQVASNNSRQLFSQPGLYQSDANVNILTLLEQQMFSVTGSDNNADSTTNASCAYPCTRTGGDKIGSSQADSLAFPKELQCELNAPQALTSNKWEDISNSPAYMAGLKVHNIESSRAEQVELSSLVNQLSSTGILPRYFDHRYGSADMKHSKSEPTASKERMDNALLQAFDVPETQLNDYVLADVSIPPVYGCLDDGIGSLRTCHMNAEFENQCAQPSSGDDLFDIVGINLINKTLNGKSNNCLIDGRCRAKMQDMGKDAPTLMTMQEPTSFYSSFEVVGDGSFSSSGTDHLLDAVVSRAYSAANQSSDDNVSCRTTLTKVSSSSVPGGSPVYGQVTMSSHAQKELSDLSKSREKAEALASSSFISGCSKDDIGSSSQTTSMYGSQLSSWVKQGHNLRRDASISTALSKKNDEPSKPNRKRLKPGENPRPRPKDRQMIQDRVKELRDIVPNGAKCSIDALLERTIKHMLFLQSVTKHADKLKQTGDSKIMNKEGGLLLKENFEGGATWAYEVGSRSMVCPIIVEDLNPPRQLLVEILCEERGFFLEIADLIRGLGLTILKGVMEARSDKIWARFAVEANRDVTRMEIFMSLVQLLEQTMKGGAPTTSAMENKNMMVQHGFNLATSIPATGIPSSLQ